VGTQYRSSIFYNDDQQKQLAEAYIKQLNDAHVFSKPIVTKVVHNDGFFVGEGYHQHYLDQVVACDKNPGVHCMELNQGYIRGIDIPLLQGFKSTYPSMYTDQIK
jgi:peptide-methionine (S)-S-oxide reductase